MSILRIETAGPSEPQARLEDFVWPGAAPDRAAWLHGSGERWLVRSACWPGAGRRHRRVDQYSIVGARPRRVDRLRFLFEDECFVELGPGENRRFELPADLQLGHTVSPGVTLTHAGPVRLQLGLHTEELDAIRLELGGTSQWLGRGVGELWIGPSGGPPDRWLVGWEGGERRIFERVQCDLLPAWETPENSPVDPTGPR